MNVGIEAMNVFGGAAYLDVEELAEHRRLDTSRSSNLLMREKAVALPFEDPITYAINAARPIVDALSDEERRRIELLITCTESGIDFSKSISTYLHDYLSLERNCRIFELKQACYSGVAGLQMAVNFILSGVSPGAKALVVATDISRYSVEEGGDALSEAWSYAELSNGAGAVAMLVSDRPTVFAIDVGANGYYSYEVMDTCRPSPDSEAGNADLSLLSYIDCCKNAYKAYAERVEGVKYFETFDYFSFHTPFGGMVKGAHRALTRAVAKSSPTEIDRDFECRVLPSLNYGQRIGNSMGASALAALASTIIHGDFSTARRVGIFSYGSGCCSEFFSGVTSPEGAKALHDMGIDDALNRRYRLSMPEYDNLLVTNIGLKFGMRDFNGQDAIAGANFARAQENSGLVLKQVRDFHREYGRQR